MSEHTIHSPCDELYYYHESLDPYTMCRGVTTWNQENEFTVTPILGPTEEATVIFTCTTPRCYGYYGTLTGCGTANFYGQDAVNIHFNAWLTGDTATSPVKLEYKLNNESAGWSYLSEVPTHGATQSWELGNINAAPRCELVYDDTARNTFIFKNASEETIQLDHVQLYRTYKMCQPRVDYAGSCTFGVDEPCYTGTSRPTTTGFDATRIDTPCYCGGGGLSATHWQDQSKAGVSIAPGATLRWTFNFGDLPYSPHRNYVGKSICLFNFNNVQASTSNNGDVTIQARLNGSLINTYYLSGLTDGDPLPLSPSHNLAKEPNYNDTSANTVELVNASPVTIEMGQGGGDGVDVYRIYRTTSPIECCGECQTTCVTCQTCQNCYTCQTCEVGCEISCETGCEVTCQTACEQSCQTACQVSCQTGCEVSCQTGCEVACQVICEYCQTCYPCYICYTCMTCQATCELTCQTACEVSCQTGCEVSCQTGCEVSCQTACDTSCQDCQTCYPCFICYSWYT